MLGVEFEVVCAWGRAKPMIDRVASARTDDGGGESSQSSAFALAGVEDERVCEDQSGREGSRVSKLGFDAAMTTLIECQSWMGNPRGLRR